MEVKATQIKIINQSHYHYHDIISFKNFESKLLKIDRKQALIKRTDVYKRIWILITPLYWSLGFTSGYIEKRDGNKYLIFDNSFTINKVLLKKYTDLGCS